MRNRAIATSGFSLIELLTVVAVMGLLVGLGMPAFNSLAGAGRIPSGAGQVASILEFARNEAMTRRTYVWVGFHNATNAERNRELRIAAFASDDGTPLGSRFQLTRVFKLPHVVLGGFDSLQSGTRSLVSIELAASTASVGDNVRQPSPSLRSGETTFDKVLTFSPRGETFLEPQPGLDAGFDRTVDISLRASRGGEEPADDAHDAAIFIGGSSGKAEIVFMR